MIKDEQKSTFTKEEVDVEIAKAIEQKNFEQALRTYKLSTEKMTKDLAGEYTKSRILNIDSETVRGFLESPDKTKNQLLDISLTMFLSSPYYQNIVKYYTDMVLLCPYYSPIKINTKSPEKFKKDYLEVGYTLSKMNVENTFKQVIGAVIRDGVYYGYELEENDSYSIKQLNPKYCRVVGYINSKAVYEFDFSSLRGKRYLDTDIPLVDMYPLEFQQKFKLFQKDGKKYRWQMLDVERQVCVRWNNDLNSPVIDIPPLVSLIPDILDLNDYKALNLTKTANSNFRFLALEMDVFDKDGQTNKFKVDPVFTSQYYDFLVASVGSSVTPFLSPVSVKPIDFGSKATEINSVANAERTMFGASGISEVLLGGGANNASTLKYSNMVDQNKLFSLYNQIEIILTTKINMNSNNTYKVRLPKITTFNRNEYLGEVSKLAVMGVQSVIPEMLAIANINQAEHEGLIYVDEVFDLVGRMRPLQTSYTLSADQEAGRPASNEEDLADSSVATRDTDANSN